MIDVICDASIVLKWFHEEGEAEVAESGGLLAAHRDRVIAACVLDLTLYELGNILTRTLRWPAREVAGQLVDLQSVCGVAVPSLSEFRAAAELAERHSLTYYDAAYAAVARARAGELATADSERLAAGLGSLPSAVLARIGRR